MGKIGKMSAWNLTKARSKKEEIDEAKTSGFRITDCANFRLRCDTIDERGGSTQRHDDVDKCANDLRHEMALEIWIVSVHEKSEQL